MLRSLAKYLTKSFVEKQNSARQNKFLNWDKIEKVALIIDNSTTINKSELDKFIDSTKKYVDVYFLELGSKTSSFADWICFTKKDATILNLPKSHVESSIKNRQYQLVINATEKYRFFSANLLSKINAPYNCGVENMFGETDLIVEKKSDNLISYLNEVARYLKMIKPV
jgi:hypothetical protein